MNPEFLYNAGNRYVLLQQETWIRKFSDCYQEKRGTYIFNNGNSLEDVYQELGLGYFFQMTLLRLDVSEVSFLK